MESHQSAAIDRAHGHKPDEGDPFTEPSRIQALCRDVQAVLTEADAIALLPGWEKSSGANLELAAARACSKPVFLYPEMNLYEVT